MNMNDISNIKYSEQFNSKDLVLDTNHERQFKMLINDDV